MNRNLEIKKTVYGAGSGVFAQKSFKPGEDLFIFGERIITWAKATCRSIHMGKNRWMEPEVGSFGHFINHSCAPTAVFQLPNKIVSKVEIKSGEEVTVDYSTLVHSSNWKMECLCSSASCRKVVRSFPLMPLAFQEEYKYFNTFEAERSVDQISPLAPKGF